MSIQEDLFKAPNLDYTTQKATFDTDRLIITDSFTPATSTTFADKGSICWDVDNIYIAPSADTWVSIPLASFTGAYKTITGTTLKIDHVEEKTASHNISFDNKIMVDHVGEKTTSHNITFDNKIIVDHLGEKTSGHNITFDNDILCNTYSPTSGVTLNFSANASSGANGIVLNFKDGEGTRIGGFTWEETGNAYLYVPSTKLLVVDPSNAYKPVDASEYQASGVPGVTATLAFYNDGSTSGQTISATYTGGILTSYEVIP